MSNLPRVINFYAGPGTGKSTAACTVFGELKQLGISCEYVSEYAKDATWEHRGWKVFQAQEYLFGKQHFRMARVSDEVDIVITDSPILLNMVYTPEGFGMPSLAATIKEAHGLYDNLDVYLERNSAYDTRGRVHTLEQAIELDKQIKGVLESIGTEFITAPAHKAVAKTIWEANRRWGGDIPELAGFMPGFKPILLSRQAPPPFSKVLIEPPRGTAFQIAHVTDKGQWVADVWGTTMQHFLAYTPRWWMDFIDTTEVFGSEA